MICSADCSNGQVSAFHRIVTRATRGFTLIELLVVISIIALLLSIIAPALKSAKDAAKKIVCQSRMKQWSIATTAYSSDDKKGYFPYFGDDLSGPAKLNDTQALRPYWWETLSPYLSQKIEIDPSMTTDELYEQSYLMKIRQCPSGKRTNDPPSFNAGPWSCWIGTNWCSYNTANSPAVAPFFWKKYYFNVENTQLLAHKVRGPAEVLMFTDTQSGTAYNLVEFPFAVGSDRNSLLAWKYNGIRAEIHKGGCNVTLMDGHIESVKKDEFLEFNDDRKPVHKFWKMRH